MNSCLERQVRKSCVCLKSDRDLDKDRQTDWERDGRTGKEKFHSYSRRELFMFSGNLLASGIIYCEELYTMNAYTGYHSN